MHKILVRIYFGVLRAAALPRNFLYCALKGIRYDRSWSFRGLPFLQKRMSSTIEIGCNFTVCSSNRWNSLGVPHRAIIKTASKNALLRIGNDVGVSGCVISASENITIGDHVLIGSGAVITDGDAHSVDMTERREGRGAKSKPIVIEHDVFIGARAMVLKGVTIGYGTVVGAGAVVTRDLPPLVVAAGNPAVIVRRIAK